MTTLREAAQQLLKAVDHALPYAPYLGAFDAVADTANALRAALQEVPPHMYPLQSDRMRIDPVTGNVGIGTPNAEPVALETAYETIIHWDEGGGKRSRRELARRIVKLYTAPAQRKPLTDEEIDQIAIKCLDAPELGWNRNLARAIERAHGIGGSDE